MRPLTRNASLLVVAYVVLSGLAMWLFSVIRASSLVKNTSLLEHLWLSIFGPALSMFTHLSIYGYSISSVVVLAFLWLALSNSARRVLFLVLALVAWVAAGALSAFMI